MESRYQGGRGGGLRVDIRWQKLQGWGGRVIINPLMIVGLGGGFEYLKFNLKWFGLWFQLCLMENCSFCKWGGG